MKHLPALLGFLVTVAANAQVRPERLGQVPSTDPAMPALVAWQKEVEGDYKKAGNVTADFTNWWALPSDSLEKVFPGYRFFTVVWSEHPAPGKEKEVAGLGMALSVTLACDSTGTVVKKMHHSGNYEAFGELLNERKVIINDHAEAKLVWNAFCDLHQRHWKEQPAIRINARTWHLGDVTIEDTRYFYEVSLDPDFRVVKGELRAETVKKP